MNKARLSVVMLETNVGSFRLDFLLERERDVCASAIVVPLKLRPSAKIVTVLCLFCFSDDLVSQR